MDVTGWFRSEFEGRPRRLVAAVSLVVVALALGVIAFRSWNPTSQPLPPGVYFINEDTGELSIHPHDAMPPLADGNGQPKLVRVALYSLDGGKTKTAAYYEKYSDTVKKMLDAAAQDPSKYNSRLVEKGRLVRLPAKDSRWVSADSPEGRKIVDSMPSGDNVVYCSVVAK